MLLQNYKKLSLLSIQNPSSRVGELFPISSSSHDYNQNVHRTVNNKQDNYFWSSQGSLNENNNEWLLYRIPFQKSLGNQSLPS